MNVILTNLALSHKQRIFFQNKVSQNWIKAGQMAGSIASTQCDQEIGHCSVLFTFDRLNFPFASALTNSDGLLIDLDFWDTHETTISTTSSKR